MLPTVISEVFRGYIENKVKTRVDTLSRMAPTALSDVISLANENVDAISTNFHGTSLVSYHEMLKGSMDKGVKFRFLMFDFLGVSDEILKLGNSVREIFLVPNWNIKSLFTILPRF